MKDLFDCKHAAAALALVLPVYAGAQGRTVADCLNEQLTKEALMAELNSAAVAAAERPPGSLIMTGPFGDPLYSGAGWEKRAWTQYFGESRFSGGKKSQTKYVVQMHFMWNYNTRQYAQVKYSSTTDQGCVGTTTVSQAGGLDEPLVGVSAGFAAANWGATEYQRLSTGTVSVGPVVPIGAPSLAWDGSNGRFGNGSFGGYSSGGICRDGCRAPKQSE